MKMNRQEGVTTVEFAIIGALMLVMLFSVIEVGRAMANRRRRHATTRPRGDSQLPAVSS